MGYIDNVTCLAQFSRVGLAISMYASSKTASVVGEATGVVAEEDHSFSPIRNSELYPHNNKVVGKSGSCIVIES